MKTGKLRLFLILWMAVLFFGCTGARKAAVQVDYDSISPGEPITRKGQPLQLLGSLVTIGQGLPETMLTDANTMKPVNLAEMRGQVLFLSVVPSVDTKVCETQTHFLGEEGDKLPKGIQRITISRDTPFAQKRFAEEAKLTDLQYLSDYKQGDFGRSTGLLIDDLMLLARSVILVDQKGVVRYIQVVPEITHLPDMEAAFEEAEKLLKEEQP